VLPYGTEHPNDAGVLIPSSAFTNGKATVKFVYGKVGAFNAVVVANNHTGGGESVKNTYSTSQAITITNSKTAITDFNFDKSTATKIDTVAHTIEVTVPFGQDPKTIKPNVTASEAATVTASSTDFTNPVVYTVKSQDGTKTQTWTVTVIVTPVETKNTLKSLNGIDAKKVKYTGRVFTGDVDNTGNKVVLYDTINAGTERLDSVALDFALDGSFAKITYTNGGKEVKGKDTVNLKNALQLTVTDQNKTARTYDVYFRSAPRLSVQVTGDANGPFNPVVPSATAKEFSTNVNVLNGTDVKTIKSVFTFQAPTGATLTGNLKVNGNAFINGTAVDYTKPANVQVELTEGGITFWASYTVSATVLK